jgi:hypothetical protein
MAVCNNPLHGSQCVISRSSFAGHKRSQGRPLGFLVAWLNLGQDLDSRESHWDKAGWPSQEVRMQHRCVLESLPGGQDILSFERELRDGEDIEPVDIP